MNNTEYLNKTVGFKLEYDRPENKFAFISLRQIQFMLQQISKIRNWPNGVTKCEFIKYI